MLIYTPLFIVVGLTVTGWIGSLQHLGTNFNFQVGNQGLEFTSMDPVWQILLAVLTTFAYIEAVALTQQAEMRLLIARLSNWLMY